MGVPIVTEEYVRWFMETQLNMDYDEWFKESKELASD